MARSHYFRTATLPKNSRRPRIIPGSGRNGEALQFSQDLLAPLAEGVQVIPQVFEHAIVIIEGGHGIDVKIRAGDAVGLLAALLRCFGMLGLFPRSFDVRTMAGEADDRFVLSGIGGSAVSDRGAREVERALSRWQARSSQEPLARPS